MTKNPDEIPEDATEAPQMPDSSAGFLLAERAACLALDKKGEDVVILDLRGLSDVCDFFVLATGQADVQVRAIAREIAAGLVRVGQKPVGTEGEKEGRWLLLDFVDVVVHVFKPEVREYYQIERLWADAAALPIDPSHLSTTGFRERHPDVASGAPAAEPGE